MHLFRILLLTDQMNLSQYNSQITNGAEGDTGKCTAARGALEEALSILRVHLQDGMAAQILLLLASTHSCLDMFDGARRTLQEALDLTHRCDGEESTQVASYHQQIAIICHKQADTIIPQVDCTWSTC